MVTCLEMLEHVPDVDSTVQAVANLCKPGGDGMEVPWHQDGQYWPIRPLATCTAWIALDDSTPENGCLKIIPGSHKSRRLFAHETDDSDRVVLRQALSAAEMPDADHHRKQRCRCERAPG